MKAYAVLLVMLSGLFAVARPAKTQNQSSNDQVSKLEVYGGYYYARFNVNSSSTGVSYSRSFNGNGGGGQIEYNVNNWLGIVGDLAGYGATSTANGALVGGAFTYLFGPRVNFRRGGVMDKVTPFAQVLFGGILTTDGIVQSGSQNNFAMTAGGGIDFSVSRHVSLRPIQAEYFMTKIPDGLDNRQNSLRIGAGMVVRLGK